MRVLAHVHAFPPVHNAGAEWMIHSILRRLVEEHGFQANVIVGRPPARRNRMFQGVGVEVVRNASRQLQLYRRADVVITHLDLTSHAMRLAQRAGKPLVHLVHNDRQLRAHHVKAASTPLVVFNSRWLQESECWAGDSMIVHPPVWCRDYKVDPGDGVALLNLAQAKGGKVFYALAERFPNIQFVGARGSYATQAPPPDLPNLTIHPNVPDARAIYRQARVVLMPSTYESWGRCAVEAAASGIPTIAAPTPGLLETGVPAAYAPVEPFGAWELEAWAEALERLMFDDEAWAEASRHARQRAIELERICEEQVDAFAIRLRALA